MFFERVNLCSPPANYILEQITKRRFQSCCSAKTLRLLSYLLVAQVTNRTEANHRPLARVRLLNEGACKWLHLVRYNWFDSPSIRMFQTVWKDNDSCDTLFMHFWWSHTTNCGQKRKSFHRIFYRTKCDATRTSLCITLVTLPFLKLSPGTDQLA